MDEEGARIVIVVAQVSQGWMRVLSVVRGGDGGSVKIAREEGEAMWWVVGEGAMLMSSEKEVGSEGRGAMISVLCLMSLFLFGGELILTVGVLQKGE